jgi:hypothetical protein
MSIKRYVAEKDNTITNAFGIDLSTRATGSNMGAADILEVFSIYGQQTTSSAELSRVLVQFPVSTISSDRTDGTIPASGSVNFYLRMYNARHSEQLPTSFTLNVLAVSQSWQEGQGLDMETYSDKTKDNIEGSNWINRLSASAWGKIGGDYHSSSYVSEKTMPNYTVTFDPGYEDLFLDVTDAVEEWIAGTQENYGFGVFLTSSQEAHTTGSDSNVLKNTVGAQTSYYTKRFFSRSSEFFFKKPVIEARWDSRVNDDRGNFYYSSSLAPLADNLNTVYIYNYVRGQLRNIPNVGTGKIRVSIYSGSSDDTEPSGSKLALSTGGGVVAAGDFNVTGGYVSTGIYSASFSFSGSSTLKTIYDVWHSGTTVATTTEYVTGTITPATIASPNWNQYNQYVTKVTNIKPKYTKNEQARFRVFTRPRNFSPTIYNVAKVEIEGTTVPSASYEIIRMVDEHTVVNNSTGSSTYHTYLSYDNSGSYFDLDMSLLEPGYMYGIKFVYHSSNGWREQEEVFKFRVEDN